MKRTASHSLTSLLVALLLGLGASVAHAGSDVELYEKRFKELGQDEKRDFTHVAALSPQALSALEARFAPSRLEAATRAVMAAGPLYVGARTTDVNGDAGIHRFLKTRLGALKGEGVRILTSFDDQASVPVLKTPGQPGSLHFNGETWSVLPVWPNGALPSLCPENGLRGPLVYANQGRWKDLKGLHLQNTIAILHYEGAENILRLMSLGVQGVVIIEDDNVTRETSERLFCNTPLPLPRFYLNRADGNRLLLALKTATAAKAPREAVLRGGHVYATRPLRSLFAYLPPEAPFVYTSPPSDLIERIALEYNIDPQELRSANKLSQETPPAGTVLTIPGSDQTYTIAENDLEARLARFYGVPAEDITTTGPGQYTIPNLPEPLLILVNLDTVSAVPDAPHGAKTALNIATALLTLEHLATDPNQQRRRGILVGFLDGEAIGGLTSRRMAAALQYASGKMRKASIDLTAGTLAQYEAGSAWFADPTKVTLDEETANWLGKTWLISRIEARRVVLAELRVRLLHEGRSLQEKIEKDPGMDPQIKAAHQARIAEIKEIQTKREAAKDVLVELIQILTRDRIATQNHLMAFLKELGQNEATPMLELTRESLASRLHMEFSEIDHDARQEEAITKSALLIQEILHPTESRPDDNITLLGPTRKVRPVLGWFLSLSDGTPSLSIGSGTDNDFRLQFTPSKNFGNNLATRFKKLVAYAALNQGWSTPWLFAMKDDDLKFPMGQTVAPPFYPDFWSAANVALLPVFPHNDRLPRVDSPRDLPDHMDFEIAARLARTTGLFLTLGAETSQDGDGPQTVKTPKFGRSTGRLLRFNPRSGIDAQEAVPYAYAYFPGVTLKPLANQSKANSNAYLGSRRSILTISKLSGAIASPFESLSFASGKNAKALLYGFRLNPKTGLFDMIADQGQIGTQKKSPEISMIAGQDVEKNIVLTEVYPLAYFPGTDPMDYHSTGANQQIDIIDAVMNGTPLHYAHEHAINEYAELDNPSAILYMPKGRRARITIMSGTAYKFLLVGPSSDENPKGEGYYIGPDPETGARNVTLSLTPYRVAQDWIQQAERKRDLFQEKNIQDQSINNAIARSRSKLDTTVATALKNKNWQAAVGGSRESWGILVKFYPRVLTLGREAVFSAILLMALLVPCCWFLERLLIGAKTIISRLIWITVLFAVAMTYLYMFHPALQIIVSAFIVMIAFVMILMSVLVLGICYQRFEILVRKARIASGEVESENISLASTLGTALSLGVSNLKKRMSRTFLTAFTVTALTFSIVAFVSVKGDEDLFSQAVQLDTNLGRETIAPLTPSYRGILFRNFYWGSLSTNFISSIRSEFGRDYHVTTRGFYIQEEGGNNALREGINQIHLRRGEKTHIVNAVMTFEPNEPLFTGLNHAVHDQQWFHPEDRGANRYRILLPDTAATALGITPEMIVTPEGTRRPESELPAISMMNHTWFVVGILNTETRPEGPLNANQVRDINGKSLAIVDHLRSAFTSGATGSDLIVEPTSYHFNWRRLVAVPMAAADDVNATIRSASVRFPEVDDPDQMEAVAARTQDLIESGTPAEAALEAAISDQKGAIRAGIKSLYRDIALRVNKTVFGTMLSEDAPIAEYDDLAIITTRASTSVGGLAKVIVPVILCVLIVLNTMMGNVDERKGEVGMLGAIGLSPSQISFLLLSESMVFSVLGIVFGTFVGLFFAAIASSGLGLSDALSFNFTSLAATGLAMATGVVVLLATLLPARKASALAAPSGMASWELPEPSEDQTIIFDLPFTLTRGNAVGMIAFFRSFLLNHTEATSEDFNCRDIAYSIQTEPEDALCITAQMWLAPYDLDVAQHLLMQIHPTENEGVFSVRLTLSRTSGTEDAWLRTNYGFMDLVRHQFLLWRNLDDEMRRNYIDQGASLFQESQTAT